MNDCTKNSHVLMRIADRASMAAYRKNFKEVGKLFTIGRVCADCVAGGQVVCDEITREYVNGKAV